MYKLWIDDVRPAPNGYLWFKSVNETINFLAHIEEALDEYGLLSADLFIDVIDMDHDAGDFAKDGGDYIKILDWMERENMGLWPIHIHSMNPIGVQNMRAIIRRNNWKEV